MDINEYYFEVLGGTGYAISSIMYGMNFQLSILHGNTGKYSRINGYYSLVL
jgi:hypothetical protein